MKVTRYKKANKRINFYINNFHYRPPIQLLIDGTFCFAAIKVSNSSYFFPNEIQVLFTKYFDQVSVHFRIK